MVGTLPVSSSNNTGDCSPQGSIASGFSASGESNGSGGGGGDGGEDPSSDERNSKSSCCASDAVSSSDYGGGASSDSLSGDANNGADMKHAQGGGKESEPRRGGKGKRISRKRARTACATVVVSAPSRHDDSRGGEPRCAVAQKMVGSGGQEEGDGGGASGKVGKEELVGQGAAVTAAATAATATATPSGRTLPPTVRRLAMSAKKAILFRHGFDAQVDAIAGRG